MRLAILWHMHQPYYEDLATGEHILPWVRLHAIKDYYGMAAMLKEFPDVRVTFNLVPSLLVQVQAFAEDRAKDRHLAVGLESAEELDAGDRAFLIAHGFHAAVERMIRPYPRYAELHARRGDGDAFTLDDLRDLQVWHKLAWMDPDWLGGDPRLTALVEKGQRFTEDDKRVLRDVELDLLRRVIPEYALAAAGSQVELSTSPFYHPVLPLLCDSDAHLRAYPHSPIPRGIFRWPADGAEQLARAFTLHRTLFGDAPRGVWPSEGSVSDAAIRLIADTGCAWMATDEGILARSLNQALTADALYRPYEVGDRAKPLRCVFRDHALSDLIGFSYQSWDADTAADDFLRRVRDAGRRFAESGGRGEAVVSVILDGENAWEHYTGGGRPFLRALYSRLQQASDIETVTMSEATAGAARRLEGIFPGSWINSDFYIWAGHRDDHRAWAQLAAARQAFESGAASAATDDRARALEELLIAEGSDWFWWYGDDHSSDHDREFDDLFRRHLRNVYRALGLPAPDALYVSNITTEAGAGPLRPRSYMDAVIDGEVTGFAEWAGAVSAPLGAGGGTMHRVASELVRAVFLGIGRSELFVRLDGTRLVEGLASGRAGLAMLVTHLRAPDNRSNVGAQAGTTAKRLDLAPLRSQDDSTSFGGQAGELRVAVGAIVEAAFTVDQLGVAPGDRLGLSVLVTDADGHVIEQLPSGLAIEIQLPAGEIDAINWSV
jgi:alpha-amylase/alpha-mannosidase (GH57 family)